jgi:hypothetical protein
MSRDTTVIPFRQPEAIDDPLSELAREGARRMLAQVLVAEADSFVAMWKDLKLPDGRDAGASFSSTSTLEDTVEFFNLVLELKLTPEEKHNLVEFMRQL